MKINPQDLTYDTKAQFEILQAVFSLQLCSQFESRGISLSP